MADRELMQAVKDTRHSLENGFSSLSARVDQLEKEVSDMTVKANRPNLSSGPSRETQATKAFGAWMREGKAFMDEYDRKALVEDDVGGVLVPEDLDRQIRQSLPDVAVMRQLASIQPTSRDRVRRRSMGKPSVSWGKLETGQQTLQDSAPTPAEDFLFIEDLYGLARIGEDELADVEVDLGRLMQNNFSDVISESEDKAFFTGTGHTAYQPEGVLAGSTVERVAAASAGSVALEDFLNLIYSVPAPHRSRGSFVVSSDTERQIRQITDAQGQFLWQPSVQQGTPNRFFGYPIYNQDDIPGVPASGTAADVCVFGDFRSGYQIRDRQRISLQRLNELYAEEGLVGFKVRHRVGGAVVWPEALRVLQVPAA